MATGIDRAIPVGRAADRPPEARGVGRDRVRLLVSSAQGDEARTFTDLVDLLRPDDLLVVNESATLPASLPGRTAGREFVVNLSTSYGPDLWLVEPRWAPDRPGPLPFLVGDSLDVAGVHCAVVAPFPGIPRLVFLRPEGSLVEAMRSFGRPIRYGYSALEFPLDAYQTEFGRVPGSAEMPSAGRPFTASLIDRLRARGVGFAPILLHAGVSSLEFGDAGPNAAPTFPEPFEVPPATVEAIRRTRSRGARVIAVGTTVVRALESASDGCGLRAIRGFTRVYLSPERPVRSVDALLTGFHDALSTHLVMLSAFVGPARLQRSYAAAVRDGLLWHEFGDSHLLFSDSAA